MHHVVERDKAFIPANEKKDFIVIGIALIMLLGIVLRVVYFFQNPNLIIDEANIARNLAERNFSQLLLPLAYEQYAPQVFLWIEKVASLAFGFGEKALRLYPLLCGIASLFVFYKLLLRLISRKALLYPLAILSLGIIYVQYSVVVKQYMPDMLIGLLLVWMALWLDVQKSSGIKFVITWILLGSISIWSSMPSVFMLAGIGAYYLWIIGEQKKWSRLWFILLPALIWGVQFFIYFKFTLQDQIGSTYLQQYHQDYFLYPFPVNSEQWAHNGERLLGVLGSIGGKSAVAIIFNLLLLVLGIYHVVRQRIELLMLLCIPLLLIVLAAAFHKYSLIERVVLFMFPLGLVLIGFGAELILQMNRKAVILVYSVVALFCVVSYSMISVLVEFKGFHEITSGMNYLRHRNIEGNNLYLHHGCGDSYLYYTKLHPRNADWRALEGAHILKWDSDYSKVTESLQDTTYFLYTGGFPLAEREKRTAEIEVNMQQLDYYEQYKCFVFGYVPK